MAVSRQWLVLPAALLCLAATAPGAAAAAASQTGGVSPDTGESGGNSPSESPALAPDTTTSPPESNASARTLAKANLRSTPGGGKVLRKLPAGAAVTARCTVIGGLIVTKRDGPSRVWVKVRAGSRTGYVHDALVNPSKGMLIARLCSGARTAQLPGTGQGVCSIRPKVKLIPAFKRPQDFIDAVLPGARKSRDKNDVPVSVTVAQAILETGAGTSSALGNNYFGIKARATASQGQFSFGQNASGCTLAKTREAERSGLVLTIGAFRAYDTLDDSVLDHGALLRGNPVYAPAFKYTDEPKRFLREIAKRYATDPAYADKLLSLIARYNLLKYDK